GPARQMAQEQRVDGCRCLCMNRSKRNLDDMDHLRAMSDGIFPFEACTRVGADYGFCCTLSGACRR
ncbi:MAG TPA: hypothetical protein VGV14_09935, partial [Rhodanobacter sp.]|nr:hypothetical protein [Rhodanobacter sp.]